MIVLSRQSPPSPVRRPSQAPIARLAPTKRLSSKPRHQKTLRNALQECPGGMFHPRHQWALFGGDPQNGEIQPNLPRGATLLNRFDLFGALILSAPVTLPQ